MTTQATPEARRAGLWCTGCGHHVAADEPHPFRCPNRGDGGDHVLAPAIDWSGVDSSAAGVAAAGEQNPFVRFRRLHYSYHLARDRGMDDDAYVALVRALDDRIAAIDGRGFVFTDHVACEALAAELGVRELWIKDETGNVAGSHKARHLMSVALYLEVAARVGLIAADDRRPLAIASCGNAALAAGVVARALDRPLRVFLPPDAPASVTRRLRDLGAELIACPRAPDGPPGDPAYHAFGAAVADGALPFTCQGNENGLIADGGATLGWELAVQQLASEAAPDAVAIQVGGGALASAVSRALDDAQSRYGLWQRPPRIFLVQAEGSAPLHRAWRRVAREMSGEMSGELSGELSGEVSGELSGEMSGEVSGSRTPADLADAELAARIAAAPDVRVRAAAAVSRAAARRADYMWPWEREPRSLAAGILDDETYDWLAVVHAALRTGGWPVVASEDDIRRAHVRGREATGIDVCATGTAGLAGLYALSRAGRLDPAQRWAVLFTGVTR